MKKIPPRTQAEILEALDEIFDKVWYNRHMNYHLDNGSDQHCFDRPGCLKALEIERKYGLENLEWDDFEWGMLNGKFSALRWVLGDDWDFLDT